MREIVVEQAWPDVEYESWEVFDEDEWLASFARKEDAEEYADQKRLEP